MTSTPTPATDASRAAAPDDEQRRDALADRLVASTISALELFSVHLGRELGLYAALAGPESGPATPVTAPELAERTGIAPRYAREWLEQQAVAGLLDVVDSASSAEERRYALPVAHRPVLVDADDATHVSPMADMVAGIAGVLADLPEAYRRGDGVPYASYGPVFARGQGGVNRPAFVHDLPAWLEAMPDLAQRFAAGPQARVADIGCGEGWSTLALAKALPQASVDGYDLDATSVADARRHAAAAGLDDRVSFHLVDAADPGEVLGPYDLVMVFEALHDMARPAEVLSMLRSACADDGAVLVADERVAESFTAPGDEVERMMYGWSVTHCLPASMADQPSAALGTVLRSSTVHALAERAGFTSSVELPLADDFFRFYRLDP